MSPVERARWNGLVTKSDHSRVYHLHQWGTLLEEVHGHRLVYLQEDEGVFPLACIKSSMFGNRLISLPFADYGGLCSQNMTTAEKLILQSTEIARQMGADFIEIRCPHQQHFDLLERHGFVRRDDYITFVLPLDKTIDELWKGIGDKNRNMIRKAERSGVNMIQAEKKADLRAFYSLYCATMKKLGSPPQPYLYFDKMWELFFPGKLSLILARLKDKHVAGGMFLLHQGTIHHAYSCSLREYLSLSPNDLIQWRIIRWGNEQGYRYLDFGRTREGEGTALFKRRWGGQSVPMPYFYRSYNSDIKRRPEMQYDWASRLWGKCMPEFVANRVGPWIVGQVG